MYLLILESIGTAELLLVGIVALIVFGPRKLPEMMRKIGSFMAEFRKTTGEFKESWEKEVAFDFEEEKKLLLDEAETTNNNIGENSNIMKPKDALSPEIKEIDQEQFEKNFPMKEVKNIKQKEFDKSEVVEIEKSIEIKEVKSDYADKRDWL